MRIGLEHFEDIHERGSIDWIAADADAGGDTDVLLRECIKHFIRQGARARHDAYVSGLGDVPRDDANLRFAWAKQTGAIWANQSRALLIEVPANFHHILHRNALRDGYDERHPSVCSFKDGIRAKPVRNKDHAGIGASSFHCGLDSIEHRDLSAQDPLAALSGSDTRDHLGAVLDHPGGMEEAFTPGNSLD